MNPRLHLAAVVFWTLFTGAAAHAQLASEVPLYTFSQSLGFYGPLDYPPLVQVPGVSNSGIAVYGLFPVTGQGAGGSGIFELASGNVSTAFTDPNGSNVYSVFLGDGGSTAYAMVAGTGLISLPGGTVLDPGVYNPIIKASDGTFYGFAGTGFYRITSGGAALITSVAGGIAQLIRASDGNFYAIGVGGFYQITQNATVTELYAFPDSETAATGIVEATGSGGTVFYGFRASTGDPGYSGSGIIFALTTNVGGASSSLTILHNLAADGSEGQRIESLLLGTDGNLYGTTNAGGANFAGTFFRVTPAGAFSTLYAFNSQTGGGPVSLTQPGDGNFYVVDQYGGTSGGETIAELILHKSFFAGETALSGGVYYLGFPNGNYFGYYSYLSDPNYLYHFDLGYEYVFDAQDGHSGVYLYDFASNDFFYTSPTFPFPYLYDFNLNSVVYYYPDPTSAGHYDTNGVRYFYVFSTGKIISK